MNWLRILILRLRLGLLRLERAMRLDAMLAMYAEAPAKLSAETVREVLRDVDGDIERAETELADLRRPRPYPGAAWYAVMVAMVVVLLIAAVFGESRQAAGPSVQPTVWRQA